jgi:hypothetical protein
MNDDKPLIPNTILEAMFLRIANDDQTLKYTNLCDQGHISLATAYASNMLNKVFYKLVEKYEADGGSIEDLTKKAKNGK